MFLGLPLDVINMLFSLLPEPIEVIRQSPLHLLKVNSKCCSVLFRVGEGRQSVCDTSTQICNDMLGYNCEEYLYSDVFHLIGGEEKRAEKGWLVKADVLVSESRPL